MRFVHHEKPDARSQRQKAVRHELVICKALGRDQKNIDLSGPQRRLYRRPSLRIRRIDRLGADSDALRGGDLVPHQGEQGRNEQRAAGAVVPQQTGGDEIYDALAPARPLYDQKPLPALHQSLNRLPLTGTKLRTWIDHGPAQKFEPSLAHYIQTVTGYGGGCTSEPAAAGLRQSVEIGKGSRTPGCVQACNAAPALTTAGAREAAATACRRSPRC